MDSFKVREAEDHATEAQRSAEEMRVRLIEELSRERQEKAQSVSQGFRVRLYQLRLQR